MNPQWAPAGLGLLLALALLVVFSGLPVWALLLGVSSAGAALGVLLGVFEPAVLAAVPARLVGLMEHDLLQALPLYVLVGMLLQRVKVADALYVCCNRWAWRTGAGPALAALGVGALIAPMNGSVASGASLLARLVAPRLSGAPGGSGVALVSAAATIGVVVPPSLVLILLGDALMRAHTEASQLPGSHLAVARIINTQDLFHAALLPGLAVLGLWALLALWQGRMLRNQRVGGTAAESPPAPDRRQVILAVSSAVGIMLLLAGVFSGHLLAVEAAATGGLVLLVLAAAGRWLNWWQWQALLRDSLTLTGALFALLLGASTFSLVFRLWGTDAWLSQGALGLPGPPVVVVALLLVAVGLCAWVLDAFEMIFVIIPLLAPALIDRLGDAQQAGVLLLLVLQAGFLCPPMGYAVMLARVQGPWRGLSTATLWRALGPYLAAQAVCLMVVLAWPASVHGLDERPLPSDASYPAAGQLPVAPLSDEEITRRMQDMSAAPAAGEAAASASAQP